MTAIEYIRCILFFGVQIGFLYYILCAIRDSIPPKPLPPDPNLLRDAIADAQVVRQTALLKVKQNDQSE